MGVVLAHETDSDHNIINVAKDEGIFLGIAFFNFDKGNGMFAPVAAWIEMMGCMVAVVEAIAITLRNS
jgi:hypothetical protein